MNPCVEYLMRNLPTHAAIGLAVVAFVWSATTAKANLNVHLSVKFILNADGSRPNGGVGNAAGFGAEVTHGNQVLVATGRGYQLVVVEYVDIQPPAPNGQPSPWHQATPLSGTSAFVTPPSSPS